MESHRELLGQTGQRPCLVWELELQTNLWEDYAKFYNQQSNQPTGPSLTTFTLVSQLHVYLLMWAVSLKHSVSNVRALEGTFNQAFSLIVNSWQTFV